MYHITTVGAGTIRRITVYRRDGNNGVRTAGVCRMTRFAYGNFSGPYNLGVFSYDPGELQTKLFLVYNDNAKIQIELDDGYDLVIEAENVSQDITRTYIFDEYNLPSDAEQANINRAIAAINAQRAE